MGLSSENLGYGGAFIERFRPNGGCGWLALVGS
jgi:hypothetical protein